MKFFNFGGLEIVFILVIMIVFLGPDQVVKLARNLGGFIRKITRSEFWISIWRASREIRNLPQTLANETGLQESLNEIQNNTKEIISDVDQIRKDFDEEQKLQQAEIRNLVAAGTSLNESTKNLDQLPSEQKPIQILQKKKK